MEKLPTEIWERVFIQLDLVERIKCMLVCRKWWLILDECSLLYNVTIDDNSEKLNRFIAMIKAMPHRGAQVQELIVINSTDYRFNKRELCHLLPNARVIKLEWHEDLEFANLYIPFDEPNITKLPNSKIKVLTDNANCELASYMLTSNLCSNLRELDLDIARDSDAKQCILSQLRNLLLLEKLVLRNFDIRVSDIEMIHTSIPSIKDFQLKSGSISASDMPSDIVPATALGNFYMDIFESEDAVTHIQFYQYMTAKYTNVTNIDCVDPALTRFHSDDLEQIYQNGVLDFLRMIGQKQNKLTLCRTPDNLDIFAELDAVNAKIEELKIWHCIDKQLFYSLARSNQSRFVQKLDIQDSDLNFEFGESISTMASLHTVNISLSVDYGSPTLYLVDCLKEFPESVTQFSISGYALKADEFTARQSQIEILAISCSEFDQSLAQAISSCFPKLTELTLSGCLYKSTDITLNHPHLQSVSITTTSWNDHAFLFIFGNQIDYYVRRFDKEFERLEMGSLPLEKIGSLPLLSIATFGNRKLNFSNGMIEIRSS